MKDYSGEFNTKVLIFKREIIRVELAKRTEKQIALFASMYGGVDLINEEDMANAYSQIKRTEDKENNERESVVD